MAEYGPPRPLIEVKLALKAPIDMAAVLAGLAANDPASQARLEPHGGLVLGGPDETQLDALITTLMQRHPGAFEIRPPYVIYIETLDREVETDFTFKRQVDGHGRFARVRLVCTPGPIGTDNAFASEVRGGAIPDAFIAGVARGVAEALETGIVQGFPVTGVRTTLIDGAYHDMDSLPETFVIAAREAVRQALADGGCTALEPLMTLEVRTPAAHADGILQDLVARRGVILDQQGADPMTLAALVPLVKLLGYAAQLRRLGGGTAEHTLAFAKYQPLPGQTDDDPPPAAAMALRA